jgi:hypothetical protein
MEIMDGGPPSVNEQKASPNIVSTRMFFLQLWIVKNKIHLQTLDNERGQPSIPNEDLLPLSTFIITSQLRKKKDQVMKLKNEVRELKILERVIKTENESLRVHGLRMFG